MHVSGLTHWPLPCTHVRDTHVLEYSHDQPSLRACTSGGLGVASSRVVAETTKTLEAGTWYLHCRGYAGDYPGALLSVYLSPYLVSVLDLFYGHATYLSVLDLFYGHASYRKYLLKADSGPFRKPPFLPCPKLDSRLTLAAAPRPPGRLLAASEPPPLDCGSRLGACWPGWPLEAWRRSKT